MRAGVRRKDRQVTFISAIRAVLVLSCPRIAINLKHIKSKQHNKHSHNVSFEAARVPSLQKIKKKK